MSALTGEVGSGSTGFVKRRERIRGTVNVLGQSQTPRAVDTSSVLLILDRLEQQLEVSKPADSFVTISHRVMRHLLYDRAANDFSVWTL